MIIVMKKDAHGAECDRISNQVKNKGLQPCLSKGSEVTLIECKGIIETDRDELMSYFRRLPDVERVIPISKKYQLVARETCPEGTKVVLDGLQIGGEKIVIMAGPCAVESPEQLEQISYRLHQLNIPILRGGAFKPRTSPRSFQGLGLEGLKQLREIANRYQMYTVSEAVAPNQVEIVAHLCTVVQIGARNMQNYPLLVEAGKLNQPVLLKRGFSAKIEDLLLAAEYLLNAGNGQVILCERGIRTFNDGNGESIRFTLDISAIPVLKRLTHLPVIVDPSHAAGDYELVPALARAAIAAGADGLLIEVDSDPQNRQCDSSQLLTLNDFTRLLDDIKKIAQVVGRVL